MEEWKVFRKIHFHELFTDGWEFKLIIAHFDFISFFLICKRLEIGMEMSFQIPLCSFESIVMMLLMMKNLLLLWSIRHHVASSYFHIWLEEARAVHCEVEDNNAMWFFLSSRLKNIEEKQSLLVRLLSQERASAALCKSRAARPGLLLLDCFQAEKLISLQLSHSLVAPCCGPFCVYSLEWWVNE